MESSDDNSMYWFSKCIFILQTQFQQHNVYVLFIPTTIFLNSMKTRMILCSLRVPFANCEFAFCVFVVRNSQKPKLFFSTTEGGL